jgi:hypothetical protein
VPVVLAGDALAPKAKPLADTLVAATAKPAMTRPIF